jgi:uncharacterized protein
MVQFSLLMKPVGEACDLSCDYCFFRGRGEKGQLDLDLFELVVEAYSWGVEQPHYAWQGGEPTLWGLERFSAALETAGDGAMHSLQTNGLHIDADWVEVLKEHDVLVGVSLDGPESPYRNMDVDKVVGAIELLKGAGVHTNILCVVTDKTTRKDAEWLSWFDLPIRFIPRKPLEPGDRKGIPSAAALQRFYRGTVPALAKAECSVLNVEAACRALMGQVTDCELQEACGPPSLVVMPDGGLYPCDHFVEDAWRLGTVQGLGGSLAEFYQHSRRLREFRMLKSLPVKGGDCAPACPVFDACRRGCPRDRFLVCGAEESLSLFCGGHTEIGRMAMAAYKAFHGGERPRTAE